MPAFDNVIYANLIEHVDNLTRVRIKVDPAQWEDDIDVAKLDEYVGYILQEFEDGSVDVFMPDQGFDNPIMRVLQTARNQAITKQRCRYRPDPTRYKCSNMYT